MDKRYWDEYYENTSIMDGSSFSRFVYSNLGNYLKKAVVNLNLADCLAYEYSENISLIDIGCGNGRDSIAFNNYCLNVTALDQSDIGLEKIRKDYPRINTINKNANMINDLGKFDVIYSRFSIHSMSYEEQMQFLYNSHDSLNDDGLLCIEARTINDELYGKGTKGNDPHSFITDHYRRFIEPNELISSLMPRYDILYINVSKGLAIHRDEDPECVRVIARKKAS